MFLKFFNLDTYFFLLMYYYYYYYYYYLHLYCITYWCFTLFLLVFCLFVCLFVGNYLVLNVFFSPIPTSFYGRLLN